MVLRLAEPWTMDTQLVNFLSSAHFVTILSPVFLFSYTVHSWMELKAQKLPRVSQIHSVILFF